MKDTKVTATKTWFHPVAPDSCSLLIAMMAGRAPPLIKVGLLFLIFSLFGHKTLTQTEFTQPEINSIVDYHNTLRRSVGASNMEILVR